MKVSKQELLKLVVLKCAQCKRPVAEGGKPVFPVPFQTGRVYRCRFCERAWLDFTWYMPYARP